MELLDFLRLLARRSWLLLLLGGVGGLLAWSQVRDRPPTYEQTLSFAVRPGGGIPAQDIDDTLDGLSSNDTVIQTVSGTISSERFLDRAARSARLTPAAAGRIDMESTVRQGSSVIDVRFDGPVRDHLAAVSRPFSALATSWVTDTYKVYALEPLGAEPPQAVPARGEALIVLGAGLGLVLALMAILTEVVIRAGRAPAPRDVRGRQVKYRIEADDGADPLRLEEILRLHLDDDEAIVRTGPGRLAIVSEPGAGARRKMPFGA
jgi:hypothetical protein